MKRLLVLGSTGIRITTAGVRGGRRRRRRCCCCCCCCWPRGEENARPGRREPDAQERTAGRSEAKRGRKPPQAPPQVRPSPPLPVPAAPAASRSLARSSGGASSRGPVALLVLLAAAGGGAGGQAAGPGALAGDSPGSRDPSRPLQLRRASSRRSALQSRGAGLRSTNPEDRRPRWGARRRSDGAVGRIPERSFRAPPAPSQNKGGSDKINLGSRQWREAKGAALGGSLPQSRRRGGEASLPHSTLLGSAASLSPRRDRGETSTDFQLSLSAGLLLAPFPAPPDKHARRPARSPP